MDVLRRWHAAAARVSVTTRHATGVRGRATGVLTAYDRFMNLVLRDVNERYTVPVRHVKEYTRLVPAPAGAAAGGSGTGSEGSDAVSIAPGSASVPPPLRMVEVTRMRVIRRREVRQRQLGQVFIKGDNVVVVHLAPVEGGEGGAAEITALPGSDVMATAAAAAVSQEQPVSMHPRNLMSSDTAGAMEPVADMEFRMGPGCTGGLPAGGWVPRVPADMPATLLPGGWPGGLQGSLAAGSSRQQLGERGTDSAAYKPTGYAEQQHPLPLAGRPVGLGSGRDMMPWVGPGLGLGPEPPG
ncbi:hypothetical protein Vafri_7209 [Volvox africanus]|nr:hypothetical protein Vafri_7209 [Volvox africanus]